MYFFFLFSKMNMVIIMKSIKDTKIENKKVILRCDLNVTIKDGIIIDDTKIVKSLETINYLLNNNNSIIILSHLGKVKSENDKEKNTLYPVYLRLKELLNNNIYFSKETRGKELESIAENLKEKEILLIENTRYEDYPEKLESGCDEELSKYWAKLGDIFVNDAFGTSHRKHASNYGIKKYLESYYGLLIDEELSKLDELINNPKKPFTVIMGGAKVDDKLELIKSLLDICDNLIVGGGIANTFLESIGNNIGKSLSNKECINEVRDIYNKYKNKIIMPVDFFVEYNNNKIYRKKEEITDDECIYDVGEDSLNIYKKVIDESNTIFINGTVGLYENENYKYGTYNLLKILSDSNRKVFVGGGDAVSSVNKLGFSDKFYYKSTGGGATLEYIIKKHAPALED